MNNSFGIFDKSYSLIIEAVKAIPQIEKSVVFGSRAMGNYKKGSDIDIAIFGTELNFEITNHLHNKLNERLPIPYFVDVVHFETLASVELKDHIIKEGKEFYKRSERTALNE